MEITYSHGSIGPEDVVKFLGVTGQSGNVFSEIIRRKEVIKKAKELGVDASDEDIQQFADNFRTLNSLHTADETVSFLSNVGLTVDDFEEFCESTVLTDMLKEHLATESEVQKYFVNNRPEFDWARISIIAVTEETLANEIVMQVTEDGEDFHSLAREHSVDEWTKHSGGHVGVVCRNMLSPEIAAKVFNAAEGDLAGPFERDGMFQLMLVEEVTKAELTEDVREAIKERILNEWMSEFTKGGIMVKM